MPSEPRGEFCFTVIRCFAGLLGVFLGVWCALIGMKYPCGDCGKQVCWNQQAVQCDACKSGFTPNASTSHPAITPYCNRVMILGFVHLATALPSLLRTAQPFLLHQEVTLVLRVILESLLLHLHPAFVSTIAIVAVFFLRWMMLELLWPWVGLTS